MFESTKQSTKTEKLLACLQSLKSPQNVKYAYKQRFYKDFFKIVNYPLLRKLNNVGICVRLYLSLTFTRKCYSIPQLCYLNITLS